MDKEKAQEVLSVFGRPQVKTKNAVITFSRQSEEDIKQIESKTDDELVIMWKSFNYMNYVIGQVSLNEIQRISLIELEINERKNISQDDLESWLEEQLKKNDERDF